MKILLIVICFSHFGAKPGVTVIKSWQDEYNKAKSGLRSELKSERNDTTDMPIRVADNIKIGGLTSEEARASRERYGSNKLTQRKRKSFFARLLSNLSDPIIKILLGALAVNLVFMLGSFDPIETFGIVAAILISTFVSTASEYGSEKAFEKLQNEGTAEYFRAVREGAVKEIHINDIVVGDTVFLSAGEKIPADGIIISGELGVDESAITGESTEVKKCALSDENKIFRGSAVCTGQAVMKVSAVGDSTLYGSAAGELSSETRESPLKIRLAHLAKQISRIGYVAAVAVSVAYFFNDIFIDSGFDKGIILSKLSDFSYVYSALMHCLTLAVTVVVVSVPEGLPMMITVVLSSNMKRMMKDNILVRKLVGIETAGSMNILFCDKTGTLTTGKQSVCEIISGDNAAFKSERSLIQCAGAVYDMLALDAAYNTESVMSGRRAVGGNATDKAFRSFFRSPINNFGFVPTGKVAFTSDKKYSAVSFSSRNDKDKLCLVRGAPELILPGVDTILLPSGERMKSFDKNKINAKMREMTSQAIRVLAVATCEKLPEKDLSQEKFTLVALVGIRDSVRREARAAVEEIHTAGVQVVMLTGDNRDTAAAVARECGIIGKFSDSLVLTGEELSKMSDDEISENLPKIAVIARALPGDKSRLVKIAQEKELVVGMTGDGVNDAPALKRADIGFAMGSGTDVAKEAGDIVILDNNFTSIVKAVLYGRTIFASIRKFITFQLTMNLCAVAVSLIGPFIGVDTPVTVVQMLWINIIMDTLGGLAFSGEAAVKEIMKEKPKKRSESLLSRYMIGHIIFSGTVTVSICINFLCSDRIKAFYGVSESPIKHLGAFFGLFIFLGIFNCFTARTERINLGAHINKNKMFLVIMASVAVIQTFMIYFGGSLFRTVPLSFMEMAFVTALAFLIIPADFLRKVFLRVRSGKRKKKINT